MGGSTWTCMTSRQHHAVNILLTLLNGSAIYRRVTVYVRQHGTQYSPPLFLSWISLSLLLALVETGSIISHHHLYTHGGGSHRSLTVSCKRCLVVRRLLV